MQAHIRIYGQVQGICLRSYAKEVADRLGLVGWVKNNPDGSVETVAEGSKEKLEEFVKWCKKGPSGAMVEKVEVKWGEKSEDYDQFEIIG